jgi:hypothetical protein
MAGHEPEKGEVQPITPIERLHDDMRKEHVELDNELPSEEEKDCADQLLECTSECAPTDTECKTECVEEYKECELPWEEDEQMTYEEDKFMDMDEGELISEILQIAALLGGSVERTNTLNSTGRASKKIIIEYDVQRRDQSSSQET